MTAGSNRISVYTTGSGGSDGRNGEKKDLWSSMLDSVASGKRLPEKNLLVLGGSPDTQRDFLDSLGNSDQRRTIDRQKAPPVANNFALGYTYYDVLDADQEDIIARISLYTLSTPSPSFTSLIKPLLTPDTIPNTLVVVLLDWSQPQLFLRQLRDWILMLRDILRSLDMESTDAMEEVMLSWRDRGRAGSTVNLDGTGTAAAGESETALPLGPSEWEDALGLPLCVVCQNADKMEFLEKSQGWKEADYDQILQYLRTILLRHGASLIYTTPHIPSPLQNLVHASLSITSLLKKQSLKHNVIDRDKILVPPNWDSWGKIRVLRDGFDVEEVSKGWAEDIQQSWPVQEYKLLPGAERPPELDFPSALEHYEEWVPDASTGGLSLTGPDTDNSKLEIVADDTQEFLSDQSRLLEAMRIKQAELEKEKAKTDTTPSRTARKMDDDRPDTIVTDHIGPVQFNMGGIQVDADDMLQRLKDRQEYTTPDPTTPPGDSGPPPTAADSKNLEAFFNSLMSRKGGGSVTSSPQGKS